MCSAIGNVRLWEGEAAKMLRDTDLNASWATLAHDTTPWTVAHQAPLSMGFSGQEYWSRLPCPPPGDLPNPGVEDPGLPHYTGGLFTIWATRETHTLEKQDWTRSWDLGQGCRSYDLCARGTAQVLRVEVADQGGWHKVPLFPFTKLRHLES